MLFRSHLLNTVADLIGEPFAEVAAFIDNRSTKVDILTVAIAKTKSGSFVTINGCGASPVTGTDIKIWRAEAAPTLPGASPGCISEATPDGIRVACGEGSLRLLELQRAGARSLPVDRFLQGTTVLPGEWLGR